MMDYEVTEFFDVGRLNIHNTNENGGNGYVNFKAYKKGIKIINFVFFSYSEGESRAYASILIKELLSYAKDIKAKCVYGYAEIDDHKLLNLYKMLGFSLKNDGKEGFIYFYQKTV